MTQSFDFRINGQSEPITSGELVTTIDTGCDGFTVTLPVNIQNQRELYNALKPRSFAKVQIYLNGELFLTGKKTRIDASLTNSGREYAVHGFSNTFNFVDSQLKPPYEYNNTAFADIASAVAAQTGTKIINNAPATDPIRRATVTEGQTGFDFVSELAHKESLNRIITNDANGNALIQVANANSQSVGVIEEGNEADLFSQEFVASFDDRKAFRTYKVKGKTPFGRYVGVATDDSVPEPRNKIVTSDISNKAKVQEAAEWEKHLQTIEDFRLDIPVVDWFAPSGEIWKINTIVTFKSETCFIPEGIDLFIRGVRYQYGSGGRTAVLSVIPPNVYTKNPLVLPWASTSPDNQASLFLARS